MILNLPNISLVGLNQTYKSFGAGFHYANEKNITINGQITDLINISGVSGVWTGVASVDSITKNQNFSSVILNGYDFGSGRISSISFGRGNDVQIKDYTIGLQVFESGNLFNFTGSYYSGINTNNFQYLQDFSESYQFNKKTNGGYSYLHNASIQFNSGVGSLNAINAAQTLAKSLFTGYSIGFLFYSGYTSKIGKRFYAESYNKINNACSFSESFDLDQDSGNYSVLRANKFDLLENGIINVTENGNVRGIVQPTHLNATNYLNESISGAYERCSGLFSFYYTGAANPLISSPVTQGRTIDLFGNNIGYSIVFSNDRSNSGLYFWSYSQQFDYSNGITHLNENGSLAGRGENRTVAYNNAKNGMNYVRSGIFSRSLSAFQERAVDTGIFIEQKSESFSPYQGTVEYNYAITNEKVYPATGGVKWIKVSESNTDSIYLYTKFGIFNQGEIIQDQKNATAGKREVKMDMKGERGVDLPIYLENAKSLANLIMPSGYNSYIIDSNYTYDENNNSLELNVSWQYNKTSNKTISIL